MRIYVRVRVRGITVGGIAVVGVGSVLVRHVLMRIRVRGVGMGVGVDPQRTPAKDQTGLGLQPPSL